MCQFLASGEKLAPPLTACARWVSGPRQLSPSVGRFRFLTLGGPSESVLKAQVEKYSSFHLRWDRLQIRMAIPVTICKPLLKFNAQRTPGLTSAVLDHSVLPGPTTDSKLLAEVSSIRFILRMHYEDHALAATSPSPLLPSPDFRIESSISGAVSLAAWALGLCQTSDFIRYHRESHAGFTSARCFHRSIER